MDLPVSSYGKRRADEPASGDETLEHKRRRLQKICTEYLWQRNQLHGPLRLPQEIQDTIYRYVFSDRTLIVQPGEHLGSYLFTDSGEGWSHGPAGPHSKLPGLLHTCRQLRTTFALYFELNELYLDPYEFCMTVDKWMVAREAILAFVEGMPETQRNKIRRVCFSVLRAIDLLHAITSLRKKMDDGQHTDHLRPANILPLASLTGLKELTIDVCKNDSTADVVPALKTLLGAPPEAVVKVRESN